MTVGCSINGRACRVAEGSVLDAVLSQGIYVAHLCHTEGRERHRVSCGLCYVEVDGCDAPVRACERAVEEGMSIRVGTEAALKLARGAFRLIAMGHDMRCGSCSARAAGPCELMRASAYLGVPLGAHPALAATETVPSGLFGGAVAVDDAQCVLCARCVESCERAGLSLLQLLGRGFELRVDMVDLESVSWDTCASCRACLEACPAGAVRIHAREASS